MFVPTHLQHRLLLSFSHLLPSLSVGNEGVVLSGNILSEPSYPNKPTGLDNQLISARKQAAVPRAGKERQMFLSTLMGEWKRREKGGRMVFSHALPLPYRSRRITAPTLPPACFFFFFFSFLQLDVSVSDNRNLNGRRYCE